MTKREQEQPITHRFMTKRTKLKPTYLAYETSTQQEK